MESNYIPYVCTIQKVVLYETKARFYLLGSNNDETKFRVLKIDRTEPQELSIIDDNVVYSHSEILHLLRMIETGNKNKTGGSNGLLKTLSAFGLVGFVRFLEGYYMILVTKRRRIARIGYHFIYKIEETNMIYIPNESVRVSHCDEARYVKIFQNIDLSSNFYFSYDLTHSLQYNLIKEENFRCATKHNYCEKISSGPKIENNLVPEASVFQLRKKTACFKPCEQFLWNHYLLNPAINILFHDWKLFLIHGFVMQSNLCVYGKPFFVTLIARRSRRYAGTRFLKRGTNFEGHVANEVETEQIVFDSSVSSFCLGQYSSFVQLRGSVPVHWSQDISKMVPKPPIVFDLRDPCYTAAALHFNRLLHYYGSPIVILNLAKRKEQKKQEGKLSEELIFSINYLNQFLPKRHRLQYVGFDMARVNKLSKEANVISRLGEIAYFVIKNTGFYTNFPIYFNILRRSHPNFKEFLSERRKYNNFIEKGLKQTGVVRVNCVDCLDRTNTAQFALGKCALAFQLYTLGVINSPTLEFDSDAVRMLEGMYEDHGDTLALQYGGSQLVHRIKTYRKTSPWTSQGNDIMQTLSRYYSNTFSDADKQNAINLFLGLYIPYKEHIPLWTLQTDYHLHHTSESIENQRLSLTKWYDDDILQHLPLPTEIVQQIIADRIDDEPTDMYKELYRPYELSTLGDLFELKMNHTVREFMPTFSNNYSPFIVRRHNGGQSDSIQSNKKVNKNPSVTGLSSTASNGSSSVSEDSDTDYDSSAKFNQEIVKNPNPNAHVIFDTIIAPMEKFYNTKSHELEKEDYITYNKYNFFVQSFQLKNDMTITPLTKYSTDSIYKVSLPIVNQESQNIYHNYIQRGKGHIEVSPTNDSLYQAYIKSAPSL